MIGERENSIILPEARDEYNAFTSAMMASSVKNIALVPTKL